MQNTTQSSIITILFDLDGTLLPMDMDIFIKAYFGGLSRRGVSLGYEPKQLIDAVWKGTGAMIQNTGAKTNAQQFWDVYAGIFGEAARKDEAVFDEFYHNEFQKVRKVCGFQPLARTLIDAIHAKGLRTVLATNPIFPPVATESRTRWAGLEPEDFVYITTYENCHYSKPNPDYYREILDALGLDASACLMVGNDVGDDMVAREVGMEVFLLTDCLINSKNVDIDQYPHGNFQQLLDYIEAL